MVSISCNFLVSFVNVGSGSKQSGSCRVGLKLFTVGSGRFEFSTKLQLSRLRTRVSRRSPSSLLPRPRCSHLSRRTRPRTLCCRAPNSTTSPLLLCASPNARLLWTLGDCCEASASTLSRGALHQSSRPTRRIFRSRQVLTTSTICLNIRQVVKKWAVSGTMLE